MRYVLFISLSLQFLWTTPAWASNSCRHVVASTPEQAAQLVNEVQKAINDPRIDHVYREIAPTWENYNTIQQLLLNAEKVKLNENEKIELLDSISDSRGQLALLKELTDKLNSMQNKKVVHLLYNQTSRFLDNNIAYFKLLQKVNKALGVEVFPVPDLQNLPKDSDLILEAEALIKKLEDEVDSKFENISLRKFKNVREFNKFAASESTHSAKLLKLSQKNLTVAMHRPESARFWIPITGFQNQRVTKSSKGTFFSDTQTLDNLSGRDATESNLTLFSVKEYVPKSARFKPNYAEARPDHLQNEFKPSNGASSYGSDLWMIKDEVVKKRSTWTPKDSLGAGIKEGSGLGFDDVFIPWKFRSLIIPFLMGNTAEFLPYSRNTNFQLSTRRWTNGYSYMEVQIFGPLNIDDVKAFHFQNTPPNKAFYEFLKSKNIEVMDERFWPPKPYNGEESLE